MSRKVTTYYEAADGTERDVTVDVTDVSRFDAEVEGLDDVPAGERPGVIFRATELFWAAERSAYLNGNPDAE